MLNENKIRLMTKAATFETKEGKKALAMNKFFRGDYISLNLIGAAVRFTVAFALCGGLWGLYRMEEVLDSLQQMELMTLGKGVAFLYIGLLGVFLVIHYVVYHMRYLENKKKLAGYNKLLKRIAHIYEVESRSGNMERMIEGAKEDDDFTGN